MPLWWRFAIGAGIVVLTCLAWLARDLIGLRGQALIGIVCFIGLAMACSTNLRQVDPRTILVGMGLQLLLAVLILRVELVRSFFDFIGRVITKFLDFSSEGAKFVFGPLADPEKMGPVFGGPSAVNFAFRILPTVIFVSCVFTILYHLRILQLIVLAYAKIMIVLMGKRGVSGAETLSATANVFMGQTEAPLIVKPYIAGMTRSELLALMIGGMATVAGGVMAAFIGLGAPAYALLATSVMAAPAGLYIAKLLMPETGEPETRGRLKTADERPHANVIDAAASGASDGMKLAINIAAMLIAFIALIAMCNYGLRLIHPDWSLQRFFAILFSPLAMLMGVPEGDINKVAQLLGEKLVLNEFYAFITLSNPEFRSGMSERAIVLATFALTSFANFASIGIQLGGIGAMAENRRADLARLGFRALLGGFLATLINASIAGILL